MRKIFKKLLLVIPGLLLILSSITLMIVSSQPNQTDNSGLTYGPVKTASVPNHDEGLEVVFIDDQDLDPDSPITELSGRTSFYALFYLTMKNSIAGYQFMFTLDSNQITTNSYAVTGSKSDCADEGIEDPGTGANWMTWSEGKGASKVNHGFDGTCDASINGSTLTILGGTNSGQPYVGGQKKILIAAVWVELKPGVDNFKAECVRYVPAKGVDSGNDTAPKQRPATAVFDFGIGAGSLSDNTDISGTIKGASETSARNYTGTSTNPTIDLTVPAAPSASNTAALTISVADSGTINSFTGTGISGSNGNYTLTFSGGRGSKITGTLAVTAQDTETTATYTINVEWEKYDDMLLTGMQIVQDQGTYAPSFTQNAGSNNTTMVTIPVKISSSTSSVTFTPTVDSSKGTTVSVGGTAYTGTGISQTVSNGTNIDVIVRSEKGSNKTYRYSFSTVNSDVTLSNVQIKNGSGDTLTTPTYNSATKEYTVTIPYTTSGHLNNQVSVIATPNKSGNTVTYSPTQIQFTGTAATGEQTITITVIDKDTGERQDYPVKIKREAADLDATCTGITVTDDSGTTYPTTYNATTKTYTITGNVPYSVKQLNLTVQGVATTATLYYTTSVNPWDGTTPQQFSTNPASPNGAGGGTFSTTFRIKAKDDTTNGTVYTVTGTRANGDTNSGLNIGVTGSTTGNAISQFTPSGAQTGHYYFQIDKTQDPRAYLTLTPLSTASGTKLEFSQDGSSWTTWAWPGVQSASDYDIGAISDGVNGKTYYAKVTPEYGSAVTYYIHLSAKDTRSTVATLKELKVEYVDSEGNTVTATETNGKAFAENDYGTYIFNIPFSAGQITITTTAKDPNAKGVYANTSKQAKTTTVATSTITAGGHKNYDYVVLAENDTFGSPYRIQINRINGSSNAYLTDLKVNGVTVSGFTTSDANKTYTIIVPRGLTSQPFSYTPCDTAKATHPGSAGVTGNALGTASGSGTLIFTNKKAETTITVTSENGQVVNTYKLVVYSADQGMTLSDIRLLNVASSNIISNPSAGNGKTEEALTPIDLSDPTNGTIYYTDGANPATNPVQITVPYSISQVFFDVSTSDTYATVYGHGTKTLNAGAPTVVEVYVRSEYGVAANDTTSAGQTTKYRFIITRQAADTENRLATFTATSNGTNSSTTVNFNPSNDNITISNVDRDSSQLYLDFTRMSLKSDVYMDGSKQTPGSNGAYAGIPVSITWPDGADGSGVVVFYITVKPECETPEKKYKVTVSREAIQLDNNNTIDGITVTGIKTDATQEDHSPASMQMSNFPHIVTVDGFTSSVSLSVTLPSTSKASVTFEYTCPGAAMKTSTNNPTSFTLPVGATSVKVYATSESGTKGTEYIINITKTALSTDATATKIEVDTQSKVNPAEAPTALKFTLPQGTTSTTVKVTPSDANAKITITGATNVNEAATTHVTTGDVALQPGLNAIPVVVTAQDGTTTKQYKIEIWVEETTTLDDLAVTGYTMTPSFASLQNGPYSVTIPFTTNSVEVVYTLPATVDPTLVVVKIDNQIASNGKATVNTPNSKNVTVEISQAGDPNGTKTTYTIAITKQAASTNNLLLNAYIDGQPVTAFSPSVNDYVYVVPRNTTSVTFTNVEVSDGATPTTATTMTKDETTGLYSFTTNVQPGVNKKYIDVTSQAGGAANRYNFYILAVDQDCEITNIEILDAQGNPIKDVDGNPFVFNINTLNPADFVVPNTVNVVNIKVTMSTMYQTLYINTQDYTHKTMLTETVTQQLTGIGSSTNTFNIYSITEWLKSMNDDTTILPRPTASEIADNTSDTYVLNIVRQNLDNDATLKELHASVGNDSTDRIINFEPLGEKYIIENVGSASTITINGIPTKTTSNVISGNGTLQLGTLLGNGYTKDIDVICQAEDGTTKKYTITVSRGPIDPATDNTLASLILTDSNSKSDYINFNPATDPYNVTLPVGVTYFTLDARGLVGSPATIYIDGVDYSSTSLNHTIVPDDWGKTLTYKVYAVSQAGVKGKEYTVNVTITQPSNDNSLTRLEVNDNKLIPNATNDKGPFNLKVPYEVDKVTLLVETNDPNAKIIVNNNNDGVAHLYTGNQLLSEGSNCITVWVVAEDGVTKEYYQVFVERAPKSPQLLTLGVNGEILLDMDQVQTEFDPEVKEYRVNVPYYHETADIFATSSEPSDTITGTGIKQLLVGENKMVVTITSGAGVSTEYILYIRRYSATSTNADAAIAWIDEIPQFKEEFDPLKTSGYEYTIANRIDELHVHFEPQVNQPVDGLPAATVAYYGEKNIHAGLNNIVVVITAPDGVTTKVYVVNVTKEAMDYKVANDNYPEYEVTEGDDANVYKVNIGATKSVDVDFKQFIINNKPETSDLEIVIVSDVESNPNEIIISVSDGEVTDIIKLQVESTKNPASGGISWLSLWPLYLLLLIIILLLIIVLICVNKDKFGKVAKKANNKNEKNDDKEAEKQK
ncbi:MAG: cadherin-like beta sandwich domain-containing protein [Anaeroplasmataceae bacterium]|nr:cadherin-like beta sandwich domain-containing protein [Anaeroplasmataceae bacterium]